MRVCVCRSRLPNGTSRAGHGGFRGAVSKETSEALSHRQTRTTGRGQIEQQIGQDGLQFPPLHEKNAMNTKSTWVFSFILLACLAALASASTITIPLVTVGDPGNVADPATGYGSVGYVYQMGEYDVTIGQYTVFLNSVATTSDPYGLYNANMALATHPTNDSFST